MAEQTQAPLPEYRRPWYHRWAGLPGEWRRRWRGMDHRQRFQAGIVLRLILLGVLVWIGWPIALLVAVLFAIQYAFPYVPRPWDRYRRFVVPLIILVVAATYPLYFDSLGSMNEFGD